MRPSLGKNLLVRAESMDGPKFLVIASMNGCEVVRTNAARDGEVDFIRIMPPPGRCCNGAAMGSAMDCGVHLFARYDENGKIAVCHCSVKGDVVEKSYVRLQFAGNQRLGG